MEIHLLIVIITAILTALAMRFIFFRPFGVIRTVETEDLKTFVLELEDMPEKLEKKKVVIFKVVH